MVVVNVDGTRFKLTNVEGQYYIYAGKVKDWTPTTPAVVGPFDTIDKATEAALEGPAPAAATERRVCPFCGQEFDQALGRKGRPKEYDTEECRLAAWHLQEAQEKLRAVRERGITKDAEKALRGSIFALSNVLNGRR